MPHTPSTPHSFDHSILQQVGDSVLEIVGNRLLPVNKINDQEIFRAERGCTFLSYFLQIAEKLRVLNISVKGQPDEMLICPGEIGERFALPDAFAIDQIKSLPCPLNQAALCEYFGDPTVTRVLLP